MISYNLLEIFLNRLSKETFIYYIIIMGMLFYKFFFKKFDYRKGYLFYLIIGRGDKPFKSINAMFYKWLAYKKH